MGAGRPAGSKAHQRPVGAEAERAGAAPHKSSTGDKMGEYVEKSAPVVGHQL